MNSKMGNRTFARTILMLMLGVLATVWGPAVTESWAATYDLRATTGTVTMPDGEEIPVWGFTDGPVGSATLNAPVLDVPAGESLTVNVTNNLAVSISFMIPGLTVDPVATGPGAKTSFTTEIAPNATMGFTYTAPRPGTFIYESGTDMAKQVQMGLYGAVVVHGDGVAATREQVLLLSEVDPAWHGAVGANLPYNAVYFTPKYWLINGKAYPETGEILGKAGETVRLRIANAGSQDHNIVTQGLAGITLADDGFLMPADQRRETQSTHIAPGQTRDVLVTLGAPGTYPVFDRAMDLSNADRFPGGMITLARVLDAGASGLVVLTAPPTGVSIGDTYVYDLVARNADNLDEAVTYNLVGEPAGMSIDANGRITWDTSGVPAGSYNVTVEITSTSGATSLALAIVTNSPPVIDPIADFSVPAGTATTTVVNVTDPDGDAVEVALIEPPLGMTYNPVTHEISWVTEPSPSGTYTIPVRVHATDNKGGIDLEAFQLTVTAAPVPPGGGGGVGGTNTVTLSVTEQGTLTPVLDFKYLITEDNTHQVNPATGECTAFINGVTTSNPALNPDGTDNLAAPCPSHEQYQSNTKPFASGTVIGGSGADVELPDGRFFVSVLTIKPEVVQAYQDCVAQGIACDPSVILNSQAAMDGGRHKLAGTSFVAGPGGVSEVNVVAYKGPIPTARIAVQVFEDKWPLNAAWDRITEPAPTRGLGPDQLTDRFKIVVEDWMGGMVTEDVYGNPICTQYRARGNPNNWATPAGDPIPDTGGTCLTDETGFILIDNISPDKYEISAVPPVGSDWVQTTTIEGSKVIDAFVQEGSQGVWPVEAAGQIFMGFAQPCAYGSCEVDGQVVGGTPGSGTFSGTVYKVNPARPPFDLPDGVGNPVSKPWIALNSDQAGGALVAVVRGDETGHFEITGVPEGTYTMVVFDDALDYIMAIYTFAMPQFNLDGTTNYNVVVGDPRFSQDGIQRLMIPDWWGQLEGYVFYDANENGVMDAGEAGLSGELVEVHFREGALRYETVTDDTGHYIQREYFPYGHFLVPAVGYTRLGATGTHVVAASTLPPSMDGPVEDRVDTGPVLTMATNILEGGTNRIDWGKKPYPLAGVGYDANSTVLNGGISGVVWYATTRNAFDTSLAGADPWEPGVPNVQVNLYEALIDPTTGLLLVDQTDGSAQKGRLLGSVTTDHFSSDPPADCPGPGGTTIACREVLSTWNQVRPGVFDGGYQFFENCRDDSDPSNPTALHDDPAACIPLAEGKYLVEVIAPEHYLHMNANNVNTLTQGDEWARNPHDIPTQPLLNPSGCVGAEYEVTFSEHPDLGKMVHACDLKVATVSNGNNGAADFHIFTEVPIPTRMKIFVNDNLNLEARVGIPQKGDKAGAPFVPVSVTDFTGREIARGYTDENGFAELLLPSTQRVTSPSPSGMAPNVVLVHANHPGSVASPDPHFNVNYDTLTMVFELLPGVTSFADMALTPINGFFANQEITCEAPGAPKLDGVDNPIVAAPQSLTISGSGFTSDGTVTLGGTPLATTSWTDTEVVATIPLGFAEGPQQLLLTTMNGETAATGMTIHVTGGTYAPIVIPVTTSVQAAIDGAPAAQDAIVLLAPGIYRENVIAYKGVTLQGHGPGVTFLNGAFIDPVTETLWVQNLDDITQGGQADVDANQPIGQVMATITVLGKSTGEVKPVHIDGMTVEGARVGGGIHINTWSHGTMVSNTLVTNNFGRFSGGISLGFPAGFGGPNTINNVNIHHNQVVHNGTLGQAGGIGVYEGTGAYTIADNLICANGTQSAGGGIAHINGNHGGAGIISRNRILFNWSLLDAAGMLISGPAPVAVDVPSAGTGAVIVRGNTFQGNYATIDGSAIDIESAVGGLVEVANNMIANNLAMGQGTIKVKDSLNVQIGFNTIAKNLSTSTASTVFASLPTPAPPTSGYHSAGLVVYPNSLVLQDQLPAGSTPHSDPAVNNNVFWANTPYTWEFATEMLSPADATFVDSFDVAIYLMPSETLSSASNNLFGIQATGATLPLDTMSNKVGEDPLFAGAIDNVLAATVVRAAGEVAINPLQVPVTVHFGPLSPDGDYHLTDGSPAVQYGDDSLDPSSNGVDVDGDARPLNAPCYDSGADEHADGTSSITCG